MPEYKKIDPPKKKADWPGKLLELAVAPPRWQEIVPRYLPEVGAIVRIARRMNAKDTQGSCDDCSHWGNFRVLKVHCECPHCHVRHTCFVPECWIAQGKAFFVEASDDQD